MQDIILSGANWSTRDDVYDALLCALGAPEWHGRNLDALWDSLSTKDINRLNPPLRIRILGIDQMGPSCRTLVGELTKIAGEARKQGIELEVVAE